MCLYLIVMYEILIATYVLVSLEARLWPMWFVFRILIGAREFLFSKDAQQAGFMAHSAPCSMSTGAFHCGIVLTTHLHLMLKLRMSGGVPPPLHLYVCMA